MKRSEFKTFYAEIVVPNARMYVEQTDGLGVVDNPDALFEEYLNQRTTLKDLVKPFDAGVRLLDRHKICAVITLSIIRCRQLYDTTVEDGDDNPYNIHQASRANERLALSCGLKQFVSYLLTEGCVKDVDFDTINRSFDNGLLLPNKRSSLDKDSDERSYLDSFVRGLFYANVSDKLSPLLIANIFYLLERYHFMAYELQTLKANQHA